MNIEKLEIWGKDAPETWVCGATTRWTRLLVRSALIYMDLFSASPLSRTETEILVLLFLEDGSEPARLADRLRVSRQSMTGLLDRLESAGYVSREAHETDRRRKVIRLTGEGLEIVRTLASRTMRRDAELIGTFPEREVADTLDVMERLCGKVEAWAAGHPFGGEKRRKER
ncbi:MAG: MarR family transcriptional regulator [Kiritimatiellae bacterium]|nr:MarR family transcriptional regulator [Kiritimatiellia bacterium]